MDNAEIRRLNLRLLIEQHGRKAICERLEVTESRLSQIAGRNPTRDIGKTFARQIEQVFEKPVGWLDVDQTRNFVREPEGRYLRRVPVLTLVQAGNPEEYVDSYAPGEGIEELETELTLGPNAFGLIIRGDSMRRPDGEGFSEGDKVIVDPGIQPHPGDYVVAKFASGVTTFKKYRPKGVGRDGEELFELTPLNPDYSSISTDDRQCKIVATMVEHRRYRTRR